jgi:capsid protein
MVMRKFSPFMTLASAQLRHSMPTLMRWARNSLHKAAGKFPKALGPLHRGFYSWYEAGWPLGTGGDVSYVPQQIQDAKWDQNYVTRRELMRRMRYWSENSFLVESMLSVGERYVVGSSGLHVSFYPADDISEDAEDSWYERAEAVVSEWFRDVGWNGETMERLLKISYRDQKVDGEIFILKSRKAGFIEYDGRKIAVQKPCLQMVEAHRVESPWNQWDQEGNDLIDGVQFKTVNVGGRDLIQKTGYWTRNGMGSFEQNDSWFLIPADQCFHIFNSHRVNQYRGISDFYACGVNINKLDDLLLLEMKAQDAQSVRAVAITSASGVAASPLDSRIEKIKAWQGLTATNQPNAEDWNKRSETYRRETGAYVFGLKPGETVENMAPMRPANATLNLWEFLVNSICAGFHVPRCLVMEKISAGSSRSQGTEVRAQLDAADAFFNSEFQKWKAFVRDAVIYYMEWAIKNDNRVSDPPANWRECIHIQQPAACNVDPGYTSTAQLSALAAGTMDYEMILGPLGTNSKTVFRRLAHQQKMMEKLGLKVTLPALMPGAIPLNGTNAKPEDKEAVAA